MKLPAPIAFLDTKRRVLVTSPSSSGPVPLDSGKERLLWASWSSGGEADLHSWPTWSPDGSKIAAFRIARGTGESRVWITDVEGVRGAEVAAMGTRVPIYLQWSVEGDRLAVLSQEERELVLQVADPLGEHPDEQWLRGSPLFFTWVRSGRIASFVGEGEPSKPRLTLQSSPTKRTELSGVPGNFCTPIRTARGLAYVAHVRGHVSVLVSSLDGSHVRELEQVQGLVALLGSPDGLRLARAISADGTGTPYRELSLIEVDTAAARPVSDLPCVAFFFLPQGDGMIVASTEGDLQEIRWVRVGFDGSEVPLITLNPSRDLRVYLRFFEQYGLSHPILDPTGTHLVLCGTPPGDDDAPSAVYLVPLDGSPPKVLGEGLFACFPPTTRKP